MRSCAIRRHTFPGPDHAGARPTCNGGPPALPRESPDRAAAIFKQSGYLRRPAERPDRGTKFDLAEANGWQKRREQDRRASKLPPEGRQEFGLGLHAQDDTLECPAITREGQPELPAAGMTMYQAAVLAAWSFTWPLILPVSLSQLPPNPKFHRQEFPGFAGAHL
jgi:hypothetical protein